MVLVCFSRILHDFPNFLGGLLRTPLWIIPGPQPLPWRPLGTAAPGRRSPSPSKIAASEGVLADTVLTMGLWYDDNIWVDHG